jgi:hypothetical protein
VVRADLFEERACLHQLDEFVEIFSYCLVDRHGRGGSKPHPTTRLNLPTIEEIRWRLALTARTCNTSVVVVQSFVVVSKITVIGPCGQQMVKDYPWES